MTEFQQWKEREEEITYTTYVRRDRTYHPQNAGNRIIIHNSYIHRHTLLQHAYYSIIHVQTYT